MKKVKIKILSSVVIDGEDCFGGEVVEVEVQSASYVIGSGQAELHDENSDDDGDKLSIEELRERADKLEIEYPKNLGFKKLLALIKAKEAELA